MLLSHPQEGIDHGGQLPNDYRDVIIVRPRPMGQPAPDDSVVTVAILLVALRGVILTQLTGRIAVMGLARKNPASRLSGLRDKLMNMLYREERRRSRDLRNARQSCDHCLLIE